MSGSTRGQWRNPVAYSPSHHPKISFGEGYVTASLRIKKIDGLHENGFIMAKNDRLAETPGGPVAGS